ncbi:hypothetical protein [Eubacterium oxidoreducens]|uniref:Uncharacterized protein n=1 Tax=Eubacterium oxidoreducens TaxID=1732 RepID=A0A1G6BXN9_EUBOX|nr:hypothetical protein [Eubacterium oxidoreducens]SDB25368.1 hypothetical protein SAMN02910417_01887 [Eubacterium oxidoreducens]
MNIDWVVVVCTIAVVAMGILAFCLEYGIGVEKDKKDETQKIEDDSSMVSKK